jgi:hypothetical protein
MWFGLAFGFVALRLGLNLLVAANGCHELLAHPDAAHPRAAHHRASASDAVRPTALR